MNSKVDIRKLLSQVDKVLMESSLPTSTDLEVLNLLNDYIEIAKPDKCMFSGLLRNFSEENPVSEFNYSLEMVAEDQAGTRSFANGFFLGDSKSNLIDLTLTPKLVEDYKSLIGQIRTGSIEGLPTSPDFKVIPDKAFLSQAVGTETSDDIISYKYFSTQIPLVLDKLPTFGSFARRRSSDSSAEEPASFADQYVNQVYARLLGRAEYKFETPRGLIEAAMLKKEFKRMESQAAQRFDWHAKKLNLQDFARYSTADEEGRSGHPMRFDNADIEKVSTAGVSIKAYVTYNKLVADFELHFLQICSLLHESGLKFEMKGVGPYGNEMRSDSLIVSVDSKDKEKVDGILKNYFSKVKITEPNHVGLGHDSLGIKWTYSPAVEECEFAGKIRGVPTQVESYHSYLASRVAVFYMHRLANAHYDSGNRIFAQVLNTELERIAQISF